MIVHILWDIVFRLKQGITLSHWEKHQLIAKMQLLLMEINRLRTI